MDYAKAYRKLFNAITDAIGELYKVKIAVKDMEYGIKILKEAQCETEEMYINAD